MGKKAKKSFAKDFNRFFVRGLATLLPTVLTIVLLVKCFTFVQQNISIYLTEGVIRIVVLSTDNYPSWNEEQVKEYLTATKRGNEINNKETIKKVEQHEARQIRYWLLRKKWNHGVRALVGFILAIILVYISGRILASFVGRKLWQLFEKTVEQVPGFKQVYPYIKQVTDFLFGEHKITFNRVVAVPYPRKGIWSVGLVTGAGLRCVNEQTGEDLLTVFIPSSPTPVTGYVIHVKRKEIIELPLTMEEAVRFTVSGGVIVPGHQSMPTQMLELKAGPLIGQVNEKQQDETKSDEVNSDSSKETKQ